MFGSLVILVLALLKLIYRGVKGFLGVFSFKNFEKLTWFLIHCCLVALMIGLLFVFVCFCAGFQVVVTKALLVWGQICTDTCEFYEVSLEFYESLLAFWPTQEVFSHARQLFSAIYLRSALCMYDLAFFKAALIEENFGLIQATLPVLPQYGHMSTTQFMINNMFDVTLRGAHISEFSRVLKRLEVLQGKQEKSLQIAFIGQIMNEIRSGYLYKTASWEGLENIKY